MKRILCVLAALLILCTLPLTAYAHDVVDLNREGSIELELHYQGEPVIGGKFSCVKVADVICEDGNFYFESLLEKTIYHDASELPDADDVHQFVTDNKAFFEDQKVTHTNETGTVKFDSRLPGLYLIMQDTAAPGYSKMNSFLVSLPYLKDGKYEYDLTAITKPALEPTVETTEETTEPEPTDDKLPQTGQLNWPVPLLLAGGLLLIVMGLLLRSKEKQSDRE